MKFNIGFILVFVYLLSTNISLQSQNPSDILLKAHEKCQSINHGYYEMEKYMKFMDYNDTIFTTAHSYFQKTPSDTIHSYLFNTITYYNDGTFHKAIYTGDAYLNINESKSICTRIATDLWKDVVRQRCRSTLNFSPVVSSKCAPLHIIKNETEPYNYYLYRDSVIQDIPCYYIIANQFPEPDSSELMNTFKHEYRFWISKSDYLPIQYEETFDLVLNNDTLYQYGRYYLRKLDTSVSIDPVKFSLSDVPSRYTIEEYEEYKIPELLPSGSAAPDWTLLSTTGDSFSLQSFRGNIVLLDFFYKSCYPCIKAIPSLQILYKKYKDKGLVVVGINPFDTKESGVNEFMKNLGAAYPAVFSTRALADEYKIAVYPTIYLIDRNGKIKFSQMGYGPDTEKELDDIISEMIEK